MSSTITRTSSPQSVLGFTHQALSNLKESRDLLDDYVQRKKSQIDFIQAQNETMHQTKHEEIQEKLKELKKIQRRRGWKGDGDGDGDGDASEEQDSSEGIRQQLDAFKAKQMEVERELANFHLEKKNVSKLLAGQLHACTYFYRRVSYTLYTILSASTQCIVHSSHCIV